MLKKLLIKIVDTEKQMNNILRQQARRLRAQHKKEINKMYVDNAKEIQELKDEFEAMLEQVNRECQRKISQQRKQLENKFAKKLVVQIEEKSALVKEVHNALQFWKNIYGSAIRLESLLHELVEADAIRIERSHQQEARNHQDLLKLSAKIETLCVNMKKTNPKIEKAIGSIITEQTMKLK